MEAPSASIRASSAGMPTRPASVAASPSSAAASSRSPAPAPEQEAAVLVRRVREPRRGAHAPVELEGALEVLGRSLRLAERRREHAEVAVDRSVARDEVADHHVPAAERLELRVDERRCGLVAELRRTRRSGT